MLLTDYQSTHLRHRITLQQDQPTAADNAGGYDPTWTDHLTTWSNLSGTLNARETLFAQQLQSVTTQRIALRYRPNHGITPAMRVLYGTRILNILAIANVEERNRWLILFCEEGTAS